MAVKRVNTTRSELLKLKRRTKLAVRGHDLLKEKRDGLLRKFMELVRFYREEEARVSKAVARSLRRLVVARVTFSDDELDSLAELSRRRVALEVGESFVMNVKSPTLRVVVKQEGDCIGHQRTPLDADVALSEFKPLLAEVVRLAETQKKIQLLAPEAERTRRRVNALKYVILPQLNALIRGIEMKLGEMERSSFATLLRLQETVLK
ncbi:MAG: V-type ATP synthase subunit D [Candidatus Norongarragalinales archaeon]